MAAKGSNGNKSKPNLAPRIENRRAWHEYFIEAKLECGIVLQGSEVKSLRLGKATLQEAFARIDKGQLVLHQLHIDPYEKATIENHEPTRERRLLAHKREIKKLAVATREQGTTLIPLAIYFKAAGRRWRSASPRASSTTTSGRASRRRKWTARSAGR